MDEESLREMIKLSGGTDKGVTLEAFDLLVDNLVSDTHSIPTSYDCVLILSYCVMVSIGF